MFSVSTFFRRSFIKRSSARSTDAKNLPETFAVKTKFIGSPLFNVLLMVTLMLGVSAFFRVLEWFWVRLPKSIRKHSYRN